MVSFRPHTVRKLEVVGGAYDEHGDFIPGEEVLGPSVGCRFEQNGAANVIRLEDGTVYHYSYAIYLDANAPEFSFGDGLVLFDSEGREVGRFTARGVRRGQLNVTIWV